MAEIKPMKAPSARFKLFRGTLASWPELFEQAADFATSLGPDRLITVSHSEDKQDGVVAVWYWEDGSQTGRADARTR